MASLYGNRANVAGLMRHRQVAKALWPMVSPTRISLILGLRKHDITLLKEVLNGLSNVRS